MDEPEVAAETEGLSIAAPIPPAEPTVTAEPAVAEPAPAETPAPVDLNKPCDTCGMSHGHHYHWCPKSPKPKGHVPGQGTTAR